MADRPCGHGIEDEQPQEWCCHSPCEHGYSTWWSCPRCYHDEILRDAVAGLFTNEREHRA